LSPNVGVNQVQNGGACKHMEREIFT